jgi:hypothetical protein
MEDGVELVDVRVSHAARDLGHLLESDALSAVLLDVREHRPDLLAPGGVGHVINVGDSLRPRDLYWAVKEASGFGLAADQHLLFNPNHAILPSAVGQ